VPETMSIKVRNFTGFDLSRSSNGLTQGRWGNNDSASPPSDLSNGGTAIFSSESIDAFNGTSGFAEYMAAAGTFRIDWTVPVVGNYSLNVTMPPGYEQDTVDNSGGSFPEPGSSTPSVKIILQPPELSALKSHLYSSSGR
jgi:hypothetical protein